MTIPRLTKPPWELPERQSFLDRLVANGTRRLLELGASTGRDAAGGDLYQPLALRVRPR